MIRSLNNTHDKILFYLTAITSMAFFVVVLAAVFSRYVKLPLLSAVELSRLLFVWACFFAAALGYSQKAHIALSFVVDRLSAFSQRIVERISHLLAIAFFVLIFVYSLEVTIALWPTHMPTMGISQGWFYVPLIIISPMMVSYAIGFLMDMQTEKEGA